ncbi:MAG: hypothetical protein GY913_04660 [Proteobacteria bacterium]|nr:hypothetical protein [Pseudomonadota bacterium]MCP4916192.1 hypothetical protein [Pseudomonadota bacterium]
MFSGFPDNDVAFVASAVALAEELDGWGTTSAIFMPLEPGVQADPAAPPDVLIDHPVDVVLLEDGGPFGTDDLLVALPVQGVPFSPQTTYTVEVLGDTFEFTTQDRPSTAPPSRSWASPSSRSRASSTTTSCRR